MSETSYLRDEVHKAQRTIKIALIAMGLVLVAMVAYFETMKSQLAAILTPDSVADFVIGEARGTLPGLTDSLKTTLRAEAPELVHFVMNHAVEQVLPLAAQSFESTLAEHSRNLTALGSDHVLAALEATLRAYKTNGAYDRKKKEAAGPLAARVGLHVEAQLGNQFEIVAKDKIRERLDATGATLKHINQELVAMASKRTTDREAALGRRLITTWWSFIDRGNADVRTPQLEAPAKN